MQWASLPLNTCSIICRNHDLCYRLQGAYPLLTTGLCCLDRCLHVSGPIYELSQGIVGMHQVCPRNVYLAKWQSPLNPECSYLPNALANSKDPQIFKVFQSLFMDRGLYCIFSVNGNFPCFSIQLIDFRRSADLPFSVSV